MWQVKDTRHISVIYRSSPPSSSPSPSPSSHVAWGESGGRRQTAPKASASSDSDGGKKFRAPSWRNRAKSVKKNPGIIFSTHGKLAKLGALWSINRRNSACCLIQNWNKNEAALDSQARSNSLFRVRPFALQVYYASSSWARIRERGLKRWIRACILSARACVTYSVKRETLKWQNYKQNKHTSTGNGEKWLKEKVD